MTGFFGRPAFAFLAALAASTPFVISAVPSPMHEATLPRIPAKQLKAVRRARFAEAEAAPRYRRSRNPRHRRPLRANRLHIGRRVRRRHRRAR